MTNWQSYAKALAGALAAALTALALVIADGETLADVSTAEWITVGIAVLASFGVVYQTPNKTP